jgi:monoterpene epsilon-lactone hydrolase
MGIKLNIIIFFLLLGFISPSQGQPNKLANDSIKTTDAAVWVIKNRSIPVPATASAILKLSITSIPQPDYNSSQYLPKNNMEWKALQKYIEEAEKLRAIEMAKKMNITVEKKLLNGIPVHYLKPAEVPDVFSHAIFFHIHGGGYVCFAGESGITEGICHAAFLNIPTISVDYRMPPDHPYPAALDDVIAAYKGLIELYPDYKIVIGGGSSGGGLTMAVILKMKELKLRLPDAVFLGSPLSDLTKTGDSYYINEGIDRVLVTKDGFVDAAVKLYADGVDLRDPYLSPIYGDLSGFPPTFLVTGTRDLLLSNTVRVHRKLRDAGVEADLVVIEGMSHADYFLVPDAPESRSIYKDLSNFLKMHFMEHQ